MIPDEEMRRLIMVARKQATLVGSAHSNWDIISDAQSILSGKPSILGREKVEALLQKIELDHR